MDRCPVELLHKIASYACTDGGTTGCSLSLVSHYIRNATSRARYHSVALTSAASILAFAHVVNDSYARLGILSLFVAARGVGDAPGDDIDIEDGFEKGEDRSLQEPIIDILRAAAPTIATLFFDVPNSLFRIHRALDIEYPNLLNLSVPLFERSFDEDKHRPCFLTLKRLHITEFQYLSKQSSWEELANHTPSLECLRLSDVLHAGYLPPYLRVLFGIEVLHPDPAAAGNEIVARGRRDAYPAGSEDALDATWGAACLPKLKTVYIQPGTHVQKEWCSTAWMAHPGVMVALRRMARQTEKNGSSRRLYFLDDRESGDDIKGGDDSEFKNWMDIENGGDGPWSVESR